jgi:predicted lipoprotein with Yx(FWY)xxD motif
MRTIKRSIWVILGLFFATVIVACSGTSSGAGPYGSSNTSANPTATSSCSGGRYSTCVTPTKSTGGSTVSIKTATVTLNGKSVTILTNAQGFTLYYRTSDTASSVCSGGCASAWPPLLSSSVPASASSLPGKLTVQTDANGSQVEYNGHPLYTYSGDSAAGQMNGQGLAGVWFVVTDDLAT